jgi:hypothetical protein
MGMSIRSARVEGKTPKLQKVTSAMKLQLPVLVANVPWYTTGKTYKDSTTGNFPGQTLWVGLKRRQGE